MSTPVAKPFARKPRSQLESYLHVLHALMLRDMRTRFGGSHWGNAIVVLWPVAHVFLLVAIYTLRGMPAPIGDARALFFATGAVPVLAFQYISREIMKGVTTNRPLTYYPQVKLFDVIFSRVIVEIGNSFTGLIVIFTILVAIGVNPIPQDPLTAICGYLAAILVGVGIGIINVSIIIFFPGWQVGFMIFTIVVYMTSGVMFLPNYLPDQIYDILKYSPAVQVIEWVRLGYYPDLPVTVDYIYTLMVAGVCIVAGLLLEKYLLKQIN